MYAVLDFAGAVIYFILNIILFPLLLLVHTIIFAWMMQKLIAERTHKFLAKYKLGTFIRDWEKRGFSILRTKNVEALH